MKEWVARMYLWLSWVFVAGVIVQFFLAGAGVFRAKNSVKHDRLAESSAFDAHRAFAEVLVLIALLLLIAALVAYWPDWHTGAFNLLLLLLIEPLQFALAGAGKSAPWVAALHPVVGLVILGLGYMLAKRALERERTAKAAPAAA